MRRNTVGNHTIRLLGLCKRFADGRIPVELLGTGVEIISRWWQGYFVHFITGFPRVATHLLSAAAIANSVRTGGAMLLDFVTQLGMHQVKASDGFGIVNHQTLSRILNDMTSCIALAHQDVPNLRRETILAIPFYGTKAAGALNNKNYKKANMPIFYVGNTPCRSANAVVRLVGGDTGTVQRVCRALRERFFQQESNEPIQSTEEERQILNVRTFVCRIERHRRARR
jgi:hypothetical protein